MSTTSATSVMPDVQSHFDPRQIPIEKVGIRRVRTPLTLQREGQAALGTVAEWTLTVYLPEHEKGTHMSRFMALINEHTARPITPETFVQMGQAMLPLLHAPQGSIVVQFPYFITKTAPVSGVQSPMDYVVTWEVRLDATGPRLLQTVQVPVMSLCPCSKAISQYGAHNQRSHITVTVESATAVPLPALITLIEAQASCELWGLLKRPDEKYVTERSYDNPKFVEDLIRDVAVAVKQLPGLRYYRIEAENFESIHNHSAYAVIEQRID